MYFNDLSKHLVALSGALALHLGVVAWMMPAIAAPAAIKQQVIQISMVAPSAIPQEIVKPKIEEVVVPPPVIMPVAPPKPDAVKVQKKVEKKPLPKKIVEIPPPPPPPMPQPRPMPTVQTSGMQAPNAVQKVAARTDPIFDAAYLQNPPPVYPPPARRSGVQGKVMLQVDVTPQGNPRVVQVAHSSGSSLLDDAALDAVRRWRFVPAHRGADVVEATVLVPVEFKLN